MAVIDVKPTCFYHPIKIIFLDDNRAFLDALELEFSERFNMLSLTSSDSALCMLDRKRRDSSQLIFDLIQDVNLDNDNERVVGFYVSKLLNIIYDSSRFEHIPLLIIDYQMPELNGLEFCQKLHDRKMFKMMLTAEADSEIAIEAFNKGLIDKFILKTSKDLYIDIEHGVSELTQRYFNELTKNMINIYGNNIAGLFENEAYQQVFAKAFEQAQAVEYYLADNSGSVLFLDKEAQPTWLIIRHKEELCEQMDLMAGYELPDAMRTAVATKEKMLFLLSEQDYKKPVSEWGRYLFDAQKLDKQHYYSIVHGSVTDSIAWQRVVSFASYLAATPSH